ncbi:MAG: hypothetical protein BGP13_15950 [Sphingobacteriales bacterium 40-81]|nr:MAG: hypothetical protein BGP13_15950 [Sphingobacteriales bacterium 40-81]
MRYLFGHSSVLQKFPKFCIMQVQVDIRFKQLLKIVKELPSGQLRQLKAEIEKKPRVTIR